MSTETSRDVESRTEGILRAAFEETKRIVGLKKNAVETSLRAKFAEEEYECDIQKAIGELTMTIGIHINLPPRITIFYSDSIDNDEIRKSLEYDTETGELFDVQRKNTETSDPIDQKELNPEEWLRLGNVVIGGLEKFTKNALRQ
jgi:hypothetical protein